MTATPGGIEELLRDILDFADRVERFCEAVTREEFLEDEMRCWAVAKCIEAIGEAAGRIVRHDPDFVARHEELQLAEVYRMRNRLAHGYGSVSWPLVWRTAREDVPKLAERIRV